MESLQCVDQQAGRSLYINYTFVCFNNALTNYILGCEFIKGHLIKIGHVDRCSILKGIISPSIKKHFRNSCAHYAPGNSYLHVFYDKYT